MDKGRVTALTLLDLSAAFDTIGHSILLADYRTGLVYLHGHALNWLPLYLTGRSQQTKLEDVLSSEAQLLFGVPQGSVPGPLLFTLYATALNTVIQGHSIMQHLYYADDSQLYISFTSDDSANQLDCLKSCLDSVWNWILHNRLKLDPSKTDFLLIGHGQQRKKYLFHFPVTRMGIDANPSASATNLGVVFDPNINFRKHISQVCSSSFCHIRDLRRIRRRLNLGGKLEQCRRLFSGSS